VVDSVLVDHGVPGTIGVDGDELSDTGRGPFEQAGNFAGTKWGNHPDEHAGPG